MTCFVLQVWFLIDENIPEIPRETGLMDKTGNETLDFFPLKFKVADKSIFDDIKDILKTYLRGHYTQREIPMV